jgi:hypothetical protein
MALEKAVRRERDEIPAQCFETSVLHQVHVERTRASYPRRAGLFDTGLLEQKEQVAAR